MLDPQIKAEILAQLARLVAAHAALSEDRSGSWADRAAAWVKIADKLIGLIEAAKAPAL